MIKNILFDLDGTLADSEELIIRSFQHIYKIFKGREEEESVLRSTFGGTLQDVITANFDEPYETVVEEYRNYHYANFEKYMKLFNGAEELVRLLYAKGYKLGIVTSRLEYTTMKILHMHHIREYFSCVVTADMCENHKPHPEPMLKCLEGLNAKREETIYIGDTEFDIECARNSGVKSILVKWNEYDHLDDEIKADYEISGYDEIFEIINDEI
ncbi:pyrophosphatase PpaX [Dethiosulfatibacter aminovorans DSM 17477]|uniref:Pyrophosphatase PpaX n=1 Tax=Dethiosulfatibacter aminovorans DSM 17477 TaxID=1121476 RepID=A0A1M6D0T7_9FIRM|nr:HAD-IA family hydrolase [Dethiosulfatibacter aminovorans]SHI66925.1 pyrophosphatase PpaX [Dethiosulfatibacter aminovorans DSM 17477]